MSEPESPVPPPALPVVLRFRTVHLEPSIVLIGGQRRPEKHVLVLALSKSAASQLAAVCTQIATTMKDERGSLCPFVLSGTLMPSQEAHWILKEEGKAAKVNPK